MESVAPPLVLLLRVRRALLMGTSLRAILREIAGETSADDFHQMLRRWWVQRESGQDPSEDFWQGKSIHRQALVNLMEAGLDGASILDALEDLESEIRHAMDHEMEIFLASLPLRALLPLVLFVFPALMLMVFGPLFLHLMESFK